MDADRLSPAQRRARNVAIATLVFTLFVIVWGAFVRATGSGAGCGSHWPACNGEVIPRAPSVETLIEYTHRLTSGVALLLTVALVVVARRSFAAGHPARFGAWLSLGFMLSEAAVGAALVLLEMVADNISMARAGWMAAHLINTFFLLAALGLTVHWMGDRPPIRLRGRGRLAVLAIAALTATLIIGTTGAITALGDTLFRPADSGDAITRTFADDAHPLERLRTLHPLLAVAGSLLLLQFASAVRRDAARRRIDHPGVDGRPAAKAIGLLVFAQLGVGALNIGLKAPVWMQLVHLLLADFLWLALVAACAHAFAVAPDAARASSDGVRSAAAADNRDRGEPRSPAAPTLPA
ncbi:MAG: COX15/CtaA family protein [Acidobacteriota bacterium]